MGGGTVILLMGIATAFNIIVIISKYRRLRIWDATLDLAILAVFATVLAGSTQSLATGTVASCIISIYLYMKPIDISLYERFIFWLKSLDDDDEEELVLPLNSD